MSRCINDPLHHLRPRSIWRRPLLLASSTGSIRLSFILWNRRLVVFRKCPEDTIVVRGTRQLSGIKGASTGHCDRSRARENRPVRSADSPEPPTFFHALVARGRSPTNAKFIFDLDRGTAAMANERSWLSIMRSGTVSGSIIVRVAREWMFWVFVNAPSDTFECCSPGPLYIFLLDSLLTAPSPSSSSHATVSFALAFALRILFLFLNSTDSRRVAENAKRSFTVRGWNEVVISTESIYYHLSPPLLV